MMRADPQTAAAAVTLGLSLALSVALLGSYSTYQHTPFHLTLQRPFTAWGDVRRLYQGLASQAVISPPDNLTAQVMSAAWCDLPSVRPWVAPANRSAACACLWAKQQYFVTNNTWPLGVYTRAACDAAGDDAVSCLRYRSTWDVWRCGKDCSLHPMVLALTCDLGLAMLSLAALLAQLRAQRYLVWSLTGLLALGGIACLLALRPVQDCFFAILLSGVWAGIVVGLDGELSRQSPREPPAEGALEAPRQPLALVTCLWFVHPLAVAAVAAYLAVAHAVRDVAGVLCYAALGFLAGTLAQRVHWARCFLVFGADGGGWSLSAHFAGVVRKWFVNCLALALGGIWLGLLVLAYTQWLGSSPYAAAGVSLALLLMCAAVAGLELAAAVFEPRLGRIGELGGLEGAQLALVLALHVIFTVTAVADAAR